MKQVDLYLGFTSCRGNCLFCKKGENLIFFPRTAYYNDSSQYEFFHIESIEKLEEWFSAIHLADVSNLNISGNDPIEWSGIDRFLQRLTLSYPHIKITLRISNTRILKSSTMSFVHKIEMSLYGYNKITHDSIICYVGAWEIFHTNLEIIRKFPAIKIQFQTIFLQSNIKYAGLLIQYLLNLTTKDSIKIVYPHFMPRAMIYEIIPKTEYIKLLLKGVSSTNLKRCTLHNFPNTPGLRNIFLNIRP